MTITEIKSKQIEILDQIHYIHNKTQHSTNRTKCGCPDCSKIKSLGDEYERLGKQRRKARLGIPIQEQDERIAEIQSRPYFTLTKEDLDYLLVEKMMNQKEVANLLGTSPSTIALRCREFGFSYHVIKTERRRRHGLVE